MQTKVKPTSRRPQRADQRPRQGRRFELRREAFIDAATEIMNRDGARGMNLADVAAKLGMTTPSIRYYFSKKEDLAAACLRRAIDQIDELILSAEGAGSPKAKVRRFVGLYFEHLRLVRLEQKPPLAHFSDVHAFEAQNSAPIVEGYARMFRHLIRYFHDDSLQWMNRESRIARGFLLIAMLMWTPAWIANFDPEDHTELAARVADIILQGLAPNASAAWQPVHLSMDVLMGAGAAQGKPGEQMDAFLVAATQLINEQGYRGASVEKIAARLNGTKGLFYHYHDAKDDLVVRCFKRTYSIAASAQKAAIDLKGTGWDSLSTACAALTEFQLSTQGPLLLNRALSVLPHALALDMLTDWKKISARFAMMVSTGIMDGSIRSIDAVVASELINAAVNSTAQLTLWADTDVSAIQDVPAFILRPLFFGLFSHSEAET